MSKLIGKRFRTLIPDYEEDEEYGEVTHPIGSEFIVVANLDYQWGEPGDKGYGYAHSVSWQGTALPGSWQGGKKKLFVVTGTPVPAEGMWCIWTDVEIARDAVEVTEPTP
jgi:hypothetical protein